MNFKKLFIISEPHRIALSIDRFLPKKWRGVLRYLSAVGAAVSFAFSFNSFFLFFGKADSLFFLFVSIYLILFFIEVYYRSMSNEGISVRLSESIVNPNIRIDFALSELVYKTDEIDVTRALFETKVGRAVLIRAGVNRADFENYIYAERTPILASSFLIEGDHIDLAQYIGAIFDNDKSLEHFLGTHSINREEFVGAAEWVMNIFEVAKRRERFWSRENLGAIPSIGTSWAYGVASDLGQYGISFEKTINLMSIDSENGYRDKEVLLLENILARREEANAIIIDDDQSVARDIVARLIRRINLGVAFPSMEHKSVIELEWNTLFASFN